MRNPVESVPADDSDCDLEMNAEREAILVGLYRLITERNWCFGGKKLGFCWESGGRGEGEVIGEDSNDMFKEKEWRFRVEGLWKL